jgi:hypothetical protein
MEPSACRKLAPIWLHIEANFAGKKAGQGKIGYFTRLIQGDLPFRRHRGSGDMSANSQQEGRSMRGIASILASAVILAEVASAGAAPPIRIAVFPFELEDFSAAVTPPDDIDREQLRLSTEEAHRLIAESGRYQLVDVGAANDQAAKAGRLRDCEGCEARIAAGLAADQSMIGIITRISRTEYAVTYKIRNAGTGALVDVEQTDLRMGANVAWSRGVRSLIQRRLLERAQ